MSFILSCSDCGNVQKFESGDSYKGKNIDIDVTEKCNVLGSTVETIDVYCWECDNEVKLGFMGNE